MPRKGSRSYNHLLHAGCRTATAIRRLRFSGVALHPRAGCRRCAQVLAMLASRIAFHIKGHTRSICSPMSAICRCDPAQPEGEW
jgi:hypothetical protein